MLLFFVVNICTLLKQARLNIVSLVDCLKLLKAINLNDIFVEAFTYLYPIILFSIYQRHLLPIPLFSTGGIIHILNILGKLVTVHFIPIGNADHLPNSSPLPI